nr:hypothetical protein [Tanacetum cinerariifolium]
EIRKYQKSIEFLIRKLPVQRLVHEDDDGFCLIMVHNLLRYLRDMRMTRIMESGSSTLEGVISQSKIRRKANWKRVASDILVAIGSHLPDLVRLYALAVH